MLLTHNMLVAKENEDYYVKALEISTILCEKCKVDMYQTV